MGINNNNFKENVREIQKSITYLSSANFPFSKVKVNELGHGNSAFTYGRAVQEKGLMSYVNSGGPHLHSLIRVLSI